MEFHYGLWNGVSALFSESGRQLGEENSRPLLLNHHIPAETVACKYSGSRNGRLINMSALRTAMQNFEEALAITEAVRQAYLSLLPKTHRLGIWDLDIISRASISLVAYQQRARTTGANSKTVSDALTSQYQFISGVFMICRHMMENADPAIAENRAISADALYAYADDHGIFISFNDMACAGSSKKIHEFLSFCNKGGGEAANLADIVTKPEKWLQYALAAIELECFVAEKHALHQQSASNDAIGDHNKSAEMFGQLRRYVEKLMDKQETLDELHSSFEQSALARQNRILKILDRSTIKTLPRKHIVTRLN